MRRSFPSAVMALAGLALAWTGSPAAAQDWPTRPVTLIVPFLAGGPIDVIARVQAQKLGEILGQTVIVENVGGGGGALGAQRIARGTPDGYIFVMGNVGTHAYHPTLYAKPLYDPVADFAPVGLTTESPRLLVARPTLPVADLKGFVAFAKANHATMSFGSGGLGSATHVPCLLVNQAMGVTVTHVPYRGAAPAMQDVIGGRTDYMCDSIQTAVPQVKQNNVKALAVLSAVRSPLLPEVPTAAEAGLPGVEADTWNAVFLPKGTPEPIVRKLVAAVNQTLDDPTVRKRLDELGLAIVPPERRGPDYLATFVKSEIARWAPAIQAAGLKVE
ncbi:tripartite tricarboxylate transporter substrate-binding protein [Rhodoplanes sp. TEM]|uniref:Tripartite tricarboxylate transporter substrate-binding protein n=1 Tax=Rhodoplanes tepidamans TaxID=200616 RepID=A0ABT5JJX0_RHOTP|nr:MULTISPECIES: tripartite tricarboxylate transporter substrate-binding protein [Rhodoplanes]MDC7789847.1 tripartite tricarboxylate transporter substrate-binding protein [Rhodoplanes tepidamans]MDC7987781.1 tripartite tricarboxylate transporter substrate-binding protein [Rhodoplanes sp. TEM]MDQ0358498.1 tripartite-type tricarboxylate transporter receptor subunit TctC [Rhodoplanes tepidamans]